MKQFAEQEKITEELKASNQIIFEEQMELNLTKTECKMLQKLISIYMQISNIEEKEIFILGGKEIYIYLKELDLIKS